MKFTRVLIICSVIVFFLSSSQCKNEINLDDPKVIQQQTEDVMEFVALADQLGITIAEYPQENNFDLKITCKNCQQRNLSLEEFNGCLLAWITQAIADGHEAFEKVKTFVKEFTTLLSTNASADELINFMLETSNNMKQICRGCHGRVWEKTR